MNLAHEYALQRYEQLSLKQSDKLLSTVGSNVVVPVFFSLVVLKGHHNRCDESFIET